MKLRRRSVLKALGVFATVPLGRWLSSSMALAQGMPAPLKFIGVYHPHGVSDSCYAMRAGETETSFNLNFADSALTPFDSPDLYGGRSFKDRVIIFEGVDDAVAEKGGTAGHGAASCLFTGSMTTGSDYNAQHESIDYYLGRTKGLGADTRFPTLNLGVGSVGDANADAIAHGTGGAAIRNLVDPVAVFDMIFAGLTGGTGTDNTAEKARIKGKSVIDFVKGDLDSLSGRLGTTEKQKLAQHLDSLRELEQRVVTVAPTGACQVPSRPKATGNTDPALNFPKVLKYNGGEPYFNRITDLQVDLLAQALACGLTRFSTLLLADPGVSITVDGLTLPADAHNEIAHTYSSGSDAVTSQVLLGRLNRYYYGKIARLMQRLDEGGVLDSTLIMASSDMGNPSGHSVSNLPLILAGGANGALKFGRRLRASSDCPPGNPWCDAPTRTPHNRVLVSICNLFGVATDTFGYATDPKLITGAYPGLL